MSSWLKVKFAWKAKQLTALYCAEHHSTDLFSTALHCTVLYCTLLYFAALHCTLLQCILRHCKLLQCTLLHCILLQCTLLHWTVDRWQQCPRKVQICRCSVLLAVGGRTGMYSRLAVRIMQLLSTFVFSVFSLSFSLPAGYIVFFSSFLFLVGFFF